jgi:hypothetical protein
MNFLTGMNIPLHGLEHLANEDSVGWIGASDQHYDENG